jgi:hypothetical protein
MLTCDTTEDANKPLDDVLVRSAKQGVSVDVGTCPKWEGNQEGDFDKSAESGGQTGCRLQAGGWGAGAGAGAGAAGAAVPLFQPHPASLPPALQRARRRGCHTPGTEPPSPPILPPSPPILPPPHPPQAPTP